MEYNGSQLTKSEWERIEELSQNDNSLSKVWEVYKGLYNGMHKQAIETYGKWIRLTEIAVDVITDGEAFSGEDEELPVGKSDNQEAMMKFSVKKMLSDKDDKTPERISVMLKSYSEHIEARQKLINMLSDEDASQVTQSSLVTLAKKHSTNPS